MVIWSIVSLASAGVLDAESWNGLSPADQAKHVEKRVDHDYVRLGPPKRMPEIFTGEHRLERLCVIGVQVETLLEHKKLVGAGPSTETYSVVSFSQEGLSAWADRFHDQMVEALSARDDLEIVGIQEIASAPMYTDRGKDEKGAAWNSETQHWRTNAYDGRAFPIEGNLITRSKWMGELASTADCDAFVHGSVHLAIRQGKAGTVDGASGRWIEGDMWATSHTYIVRDHYLAAAEAGGHFTPPKFAPKVNPWVMVGSPKNVVEFQAFVVSEANDAVTQSNFVEPIDATYGALAEMNAMAFDLAYPK